LALADFLKQSGTFTRSGQSRTVRALPQLEDDDVDNGERTDEEAARGDGTSVAVIMMVRKQSFTQRACAAISNITLQSSPCPIALVHVLLKSTLSSRQGGTQSDFYR